MTRILPVLATPHSGNAKLPAVTDASVYVIDDELAVWLGDQSGITKQIKLPESVDPLDLSVKPGGFLHVLSGDESGSRIFRATDKQGTHWEEIEVAASLRRIACASDGRIWA